MQCPQCRSRRIAYRLREDKNGVDLKCLAKECGARWQGRPPERRRRGRWICRWCGSFNTRVIRQTKEYAVGVSPRLAREVYSVLGAGYVESRVIGVVAFCECRRCGKTFEGRSSS